MKKIIYMLLYVLFLTPAQATENEDILIKLQGIINSVKAEVGVAVRMAGKEIITINDDIKFPLQSVFKLHQALAVCNELEKRNISLDQKIKLKKSDLASNTWSPLRKKFPDGIDSISMRDLIEYTLIYSDNNTSDILFAKVIDTAATDKFIRNLG